MSKVYLNDLFPAYLPGDYEAIWNASEVTQAEIETGVETVHAECACPRYVPRAELEHAEETIARIYGLRKLVLQPCFPASELASAAQDFARILTDAYSPAAAITAGAEWTVTEESVTLRLRANGKEQIQPYARILEDYIRTCFGTERRLLIQSSHSDADEKEKLFEETERMRTEAMQLIPPPQEKKAKPEGPVVIYGKNFNVKTVPMDTLTLDMPRTAVEGVVLSVNHRELKNKKAWVVSFDLTDYTNSVRISQFMREEEAKPILNGVKPGEWYRILGDTNLDRYEHEVVMRPISIVCAPKRSRQDTAEEKRVELHLHTRMSAMDALTETAAAIKRAAGWGHRAIAITDHGVLQAFPDVIKAMKDHNVFVKGTEEEIKVLFGCEAYFVNDVDDRIVVHGTANVPLNGVFVAFDLETTGLNPEKETIIEIGAVAYENGEPGEHYRTFVNPHRRLERKIVELTGITDAMLEDAPDEADAIPAFLAWCGDRPMVAHNADFDVSFLAAACERLHIPFEPTSIDTLIMAQNLLPELGKYKLNIVADALSLPDFQHHRADDDAMTVAYMMQRFFKMLKEAGITDTAGINAYMQTLRSGTKLTGRHSRHMILLAKNQLGLRNLYHLTSLAHLQYFHRNPCIPKSELNRMREGLIVGSACEAGELFQAIVNRKSHSELQRIASYYDFLEIQPLANNRFMIEKGIAADDEQLREFNRTVVRLGEELNIPVVATGDVHFLDPEQEIYRHILLTSKGYDDADRDLPLYFKTTDEMLAEFSYLGEEKAREVVVVNPNRIADMCERMSPVPKGLFAPKIERSAETLQELVYGRLKELYGDNPPELIQKRVDQEMHDIIGRHYDVIYMSAQQLVQDSLEHGYLVGSRGSVGSSLVAYLSGITEVNAFPPHYRCPNCHYTTFDVPEGCECGPDLPDAVCPECGSPLAKEGFNIPFETFLGFGGDKVPDIDLNFSGEYQARAHAHCVEMFGAEHVFRAGTITKVQDKIAYGYVKKYLEKHNRVVCRAEEERLKIGCSEVKKSTGQHPGGLVVIPQENEIWDFCPVQHPADSTAEDAWITTHFEYHCMEENLLKLDMLGHDDPTMIRMLEDMTGVDAKKIPLDDADTMSIFRVSDVLGYSADPILGPTGAVGIPEYNTRFARQMLMDIQPTQFNTLVRFVGFSHGTDVWLGNARDLIIDQGVPVNDAIGCRDDIMIYLIRCGLPEKRAFKIMEAVRKGRGLPSGAEEEMKAASVPDWYIESCKKIKYLFPKAHAVAYVMMAFRIAWFKVHYPLAFYSAYFYRRSQGGNFDAEMMTNGIERVKEAIHRIDNDPNASKKEQDLVPTLEVCYEFYLRGLEFAKIDLYESDAMKFNIRDEKLLPPFVSVAGLGEAAAKNIAEGRKGRMFLSVEECRKACGISEGNLASLKAAGVFDDLPESNQVSFF